MVRRFAVLKFISHDIVLNGILSGTSFPSSKINSANNSVTFFFLSMKLWIWLLGRSFMSSLKIGLYWNMPFFRLIIQSWKNTRLFYKFSDTHLNKFMLSRRSNFGVPPINASMILPWPTCNLAFFNYVCLILLSGIILLLRKETLTDMLSHLLYHIELQSNKSYFLNFTQILVTSIPTSACHQYVIENYKWRMRQRLFIFLLKHSPVYIALASEYSEKKVSSAG